jgi:hypothetical protein
MAGEKKASNVEQASPHRTADKPVRGRPFGPGHPGNPGGRPKGIAAYVRRKTRDGQKMVDFMLDVLEGKPMEMTKLLFEPPTEIKWKQTPSLHHRMEAAAWLADRGFGKAREHLEIESESRGFLFLLRHVPGSYDPLATEHATEELTELPPMLPAPNGCG